MPSQVEQRDPSEPTTRPPRRRHRPLLVGLLALTLVAAGVAVYGAASYVLRDEPDARSVDDALEDYRAGSASTTPELSTFARPAPGVYTAAGKGGEAISKPPNSQTDGAVMPVSVEFLAKGCWRWRIDYNEAHWHEFDFCPDDAGLKLVAQRNYQAWDFGLSKVTNTGDYTCTPPSPIVIEDPQGGERFVHHCTGTNSAVEGPSTAEGPANITGVVTLTIDGKPVKAIHQTRRSRMSGSQQGVTDEEWWFATDTGLPLRSARDYTIRTDSPIGSITYTEQGWWQLTSLSPRS